MLLRAVRLAERLGWRSGQESANWVGRSFAGPSLESLLVGVVCNRLHFQREREEDRRGRRDHHRIEVGRHIAEGEGHRLEDRRGRGFDLDLDLEDHPKTSKVLAKPIILFARCSQIKCKCDEHIHIHCSAVADTAAVDIVARRIDWGVGIATGMKCMRTAVAAIGNLHLDTLLGVERLVVGHTVVVVVAAAAGTATQAAGMAVVMHLAEEVPEAGYKVTAVVVVVVEGRDS